MMIIYQKMPYIDKAFMTLRTKRSNLFRVAHIVETTQILSRAQKVAKFYCTSHVYHVCSS